MQGDFYDKNLFAYCDNNPVVRVDHGGQIWIYAALGGGIGDCSMKKCMIIRSKTEKIWRKIEIISLLILGVFSSSLGILFIIDSIFLNDNLGVYLCLICFTLGWGIFCIYVAMFTYYIDSREYSLSVQGIRLRSMKRYLDEYSWDDITEISVCDVHHATKGPAFLMVIRLVVGSEKNGPSNLRCTVDPMTGYEHWRREQYDWKNYKQIILIEYRPERLEEIKQMSNKEIKDYRTRKGKEQDIKI